MIRFKFLTGDVNYLTYGGKWISNVQKRGDVEFFFVIEVMNWIEAVGERDAEGKPTYNMSLTIVSPQQAGEKKMEEAYSCCGVDDEIIENATKNGALAELQVESLHSYAGGVPVWSEDGNNFHKLFAQARQEAGKADFDCVMEAPVNRLGETGREALKLTDPREVLDRILAQSEEPTPEQRIVAKMYGMG